jgi:hypothetical protein
MKRHVDPLAVELSSHCNLAVDPSFMNSSQDEMCHSGSLICMLLNDGLDESYWFPFDSLEPTSRHFGRSELNFLMPTA